MRDGKFVAIGTRAECGAAAGKGAKVDSTFEGKVVIAGFVEQHVHPLLALQPVLRDGARGALRQARHRAGALR